MPSDYSALVPWGLAVLVLAVGTVLSVLVAKRLERSVVWLCGVGCFVLLAVYVLRFLWAADVIRPTPGRDYKVFELGVQVAPFVEAAGLALVIAAALRAGRTRKDPVEPAARPGALLARTVGFPVWAVGVAVLLVVGGLVGVLAMVPADDAVPRLVRGTITEHVDAHQGFRFVADDDPDDPEVYWPNSRFWVDSRGAQRNDAKPTCLRPDAPLPQRAELAFLDITGSREHVFGDFPYLLSVRCLD